MEWLSRSMAGRIALFASSIPLALAATAWDMVPGTVAVVLGAAPPIGFLLWELTTSRRALIQEHAAHVAKSAYLADMSHELRTPLNAIIGFAEMIRDEMLGPCGHDKYREFATDIHGASLHLLAVINDVLELSKIEAGQLELDEQPMDLGTVAQSCHRLMREQARRAGLTLTVETAPDLPMVYGDALKIKQVLLNLISNALKFTHRGGCVCIRVGRAADGKVFVAVVDNGVGIPAHEIPRVLTPFAQAAHTRLMTDQGTGLGLPLAKRLMELHGGTLDLHSTVGTGTRVTIIFPAERSHAAGHWHPATLAEAPASA